MVALLRIATTRNPGVEVALSYVKQVSLSSYATTQFDLRFSELHGPSESVGVLHFVNQASGVLFRPGMNFNRLLV